MKPLFPTSLALLLVMGSLGQVFAAAFCSRVLGRECCLAKTPGHTHKASAQRDISSSHHDMAMHSMPMNGMTMDEMAMDNMATDDMAMDGVVMDHLAMNEDGMPLTKMSAMFSSSLADDEALTSKVEQPVETCSHCLSHSGILNAPLSSMSVPNQSTRDSVPLPVSRFLVRSAMTVAQSGLPADHAPPGSSSAPRHILISVFLI